MAKRRALRVVFVYVAVATGFGVVVADAEASTLSVETVQCGQLVDHSVRVANNLQDCPHDGLVVAADNITIDLGGHRIDGSGASVSAGVNNTGHLGVTIRNGVVTGFDFGVSFSSNAQGVVSDVQVFDNSYGIEIANCPLKSTIKNNTASGNSIAGISLFGATTSIFQGNTTSGNPADGILINDASGPAFVGNHASGNGAQGIDVSKSVQITMKGNTVSGNAGNGIMLVLCSRSTLKHNTIWGNGSDGIELTSAANNTLETNTVSGNDDDGIRVGTSTGNVLKGNVTTENGFHGISSLTSELTLTGNRADRNGFIGGGPGDDNGSGIVAPAGTTNGSNKATGNDDPHECEPADMGCFVP